MRRGIQVLILTATVGLLWSPVPAAADVFVSPWVGTNFATEPADGRASFGVTAGGMGGGIIGGEVDFGYSPNYFGDGDTFGSNNLMNLMGNLIVGIPIGGQRGAGIRPYVTGGLGMIRTSIDGPFGDDGRSNNDFAFNVGAGVMGFFNSHVGLRGDVRYMRTINSDLGDTDFDPELGLGDFDFWRVSFGVVFR
jgi:opacity protein-like surface antigen